MARRSYSEETKAAVMAALLEGQSLNYVAKQYKIPKSTIANWSAELNRDGMVPDQKKEEIGDLLICYVALSLKTLQRQVKKFADEKWLEQQSASEVAVLHGVIADKTIRLLEALAGDAEEED